MKNSIKKRVRKVKNSVKKRWNKLKESVNKRIGKIKDFFRTIRDVIRGVRSGMRKVNYFWKMAKDMRRYMRAYSKRNPAPNRIATDFQ